MTKPNRYDEIIEHIFLARHAKRVREILFGQEDLVRAADELGIKLPKKLDEPIDSFRYQAALPEAVRDKAPRGKIWKLRPAGKAIYAFTLVSDPPIIPTRFLGETKLHDSTPGIIIKHSFSKRQTLLARIRHNRLMDIFAGMACYPVHSSCPTTVPEMGVVETSEIYLATGQRGTQYVFPLIAIAGSGKKSIGQIEQGFAYSKRCYSALACFVFGALPMPDDRIALFQFQDCKDRIGLIAEKHFRLLSCAHVSETDILPFRRYAPGA